MRITSITPYNLQTIHNNKEINKQNFNTLPQVSGNLPTTIQYLAFTGGYSINLAKTIERLDILAQKKSNLYPPNIREWAGMILEEGNKNSETLIDIHKKFYASLKDCLSIKEVKEKFPEFKDVLSENDVQFSKDTIFDSIKKGEMEFFDTEEDLSLQLLKLYWGEGFSLNDLKKYTNGKDLYHTIKKLNIPTVDRDYGHILKLSDPDYNERLTREMTEKRLAALDRKAQIEQGEPVYIKRGPLSAAHKQKIAEGLKKYYEANPERIYAMSERQKEFYHNNPEKAEELKRVLNKAWNIFGADKIKDALSGFMKKHGIKDFKPDTNPADLSQKQSNIIKQFWGANEWARKSFSKNMKYAWKKVKEENETFFTLRSTPTQLTRFIEKKAGMKPGTLKNDTVFNPYTMESSIDENANELSKKYTNIKDLNNVMADTYQIAVLNIAAKLNGVKLPRKNRVNEEFLNLLAYTIRKNLENGGKGYKIQYTNEAQQDFITLAAYAAKSRNEYLINIVNQALDDAFELASDVHPDFILK